MACEMVITLYLNVYLIKNYTLIDFLCHIAVFNLTVAERVNHPIVMKCLEGELSGTKSLITMCGC